MEVPATAWDTVYCLRAYNPHKINGVRNPKFDRALDGRLLDFKDGQHYAVVAETKLFRAALGVINLPHLAVVAIVPGHRARVSNMNEPLAFAAEELGARDSRLMVAVNTIRRTVDVPRMASGGLRSAQAHVESMVVSDTLDLRGTVVLLLDDIVTTGHSVDACRILLRRRGAARVAAVALARTVRYSDSHVV